MESKGLDSPEQHLLPQVHTVGSVPAASSAEYYSYDVSGNDSNSEAFSSRDQVKRPLKVSLGRLMCLNMLVSGIELCASVGFTYAPPMLLKAGFSEASMTCLMGIGPFIALMTVPFLGHWSDRCQSRFGRRRPFIFAVSMIIIISLILIPHASRTGFMALGVILLDFGCHAGFNPCEALVSDTMSQVEAKDQGFIVYSSMVSLGGCVGYFITALDWSSFGLTMFLGGQEQVAFCVLLVLFVIMLTVTLAVANEKPLQINNNNNYAIAHHVRNSSDDIEDVGYETSGEDSLDNIPGLGRTLASSVTNTSLPKSPSKSKWRRGWPLICTKYFFSAVVDILRQKVGRLACLYGSVPYVLRRLFLADLCSWMALMCHNMFYTDYVAQAIYKGNPNDVDGSEARELYDEGVRMGSWGLLAHSATAIIYASLMQKTVMQMYGMNRAYFYGLLTFAICMICTMLTSNLVAVNFFAALSGLGFAAITTIPYMLITAYHANKDVYFGHPEGKMSHRIENVETRGIAADIAILDSACILSQILLSVVVGEIVEITQSVTAYIAISALFGFLACYFSLKVVFTSFDMVVGKSTQATSIF